MKRRLRAPLCLSAAAVAVLCTALATTAHADPVALDYHAKVEGCPPSDRLADEVSARLGFVPWDAQAPVAVRIRISSDSGELVGTIEQPDGASKVLRAPTCPALHASIVSALAVVLDRQTGGLATASAARVGGAAPDAPERRLRKLEPPPARNALLTVHLRAKGSRSLEAHRMTQATSLYTAHGTVSAMSFENLCQIPCTAYLREGSHTLGIVDLATAASAAADASIKVNSTIEIDYTSRDQARRSTVRGRKLGLLAGFVVGTAVSAYLVETQFPDMEGKWAMHSLDPLGGLLVGVAGMLIANAFTPGLRADSVEVKVRPGLGSTAGL